MRGHPYVKSAIDMACWDILGQAAGLPVATLMGGHVGDDFALYRAISQEAPDQMAARVAQYRAEGYRKFQLKVGGDPDTDIDRIRAAAAVLERGDVLIADANTGWTQHAALRVADAVRDVDVYIEQPCATYGECLTVRRHTNRPFILDEVIDTLVADADVAAWEKAVTDFDAKLRRLEPVNLAAIAEHAEAAQRKDYLDAQDADLTSALETLEDAIRKIDRETRGRFKDTFDRVNSGVQELYPRLFGGGHAYLELTGEDLLDTGVAIMARPPGKRVSNISLLSGGEKAMTAVALVFAIFRLNPAPFCLLDEVDAPLDEANVGRFTTMVSEMSEQVQFLFVTHNKATMEAAQQLSGVTMREPGVSRLVSVDLAEAARLAGAA